MYLRTFKDLKLESNKSDQNTSSRRGPNKSTLLYLAYITLEQGVDKEEFAELAWKDSTDPKAAREQSIARNTVIDDYTVLEQDGNLLKSHLKCDIDEFIKLLDEQNIEAALELYQGEFLEGVEKGNASFRDWILERRKYYAELLLEGLLGFVEQNTSANIRPKLEHLEKINELIQLIASLSNPEEDLSVIREFLIRAFRIFDKYKSPLRSRIYEAVEQIGMSPQSFRAAVQAFPVLEENSSTDSSEPPPEEPPNSGKKGKSLALLWFGSALFLLFIWWGFGTVDRDAPELSPLKFYLNDLSGPIASFWGLIWTGFFFFILLTLTKMYEQYVNSDVWHEKLPNPFGVKLDLAEPHTIKLKVAMFILFFLGPLYAQMHFTGQFFDYGSVLEVTRDVSGKKTGLKEVTSPSFCKGNGYCEKLLYFYPPSVMLGLGSKFRYGSSEDYVAYAPFYQAWGIVLVDILLIWLFVRLSVVRGFFTGLYLLLKKAIFRRAS